MKKILIQDLKKIKKVIKYFLLKDYLKERDPADIDILCYKKDKRKLDKLLTKLGYRTFKIYHDNAFYHKFYQSTVIRLHFHFDSIFSSIKTKFVSEHAYYSNSIPIASPTRYLISSFYKLKIGESTKKYLPRIKNNLEGIDYKLLFNTLELIFYSEGARKAVELLKKKEIKKSLSFLELRRYFKMKERINNIFSAFLKIRVVMKQLVHPSPYITIVGTDGSGKTTTVNNIHSVLTRHKFRVVKEPGTRIRFQYLPLNLFTKKLAQKKIKEGASKDVIVYKSNILRYFTPFVYYIEYLLRYIFSISIKRRKNNFVLTDRSFIDVLVSPNSNPKLARFLYRILPKPSKVFFLYNDADVLIKRRPDHPAEDIVRQLKAYKENSNLYSHSIKTISEEDTLAKILKYL